MDLFVEQLKQLCAAYPTRSKWVFVPAHAIGRTLGDRLVLEGADWANLRFVTPLDVALRMGAPFLVERGIDPSEEGLGPALVMRLLLGLPEAGGYFRPLATQPTMAIALWSTLRELRMAGVRADDVPAGAFASADKHRELRALLGAYEKFLVTNSRGDLAAVYEEAIQHPDWCPIQAQDCWIAQPDVLWSPLQRRLVDAMPGQQIVPRAFALPGVSLPRRLQDAPADRQAPEPESSLAFLMAPEARVPSAKSRVPALFHAGGPEAEIEEVFRQILVSGRSLDRAEIVCASPQYSTLVWEKAMRYDWPVTMAQGIPAVLTRPGRSLLALTEWIEDDFAAGRLRRMLQSGDLTMGEGAAISSGRAARLLMKAQAAWGRETYRLSLGRLAKSSRTRSRQDDLPEDQREGLEQRAQEADELARWIGELIAAVPAPGVDGLVDLKRMVDGARTFLDSCAARTSALDSVTASSLSDSVGELLALEELRCPLGQALRFLRERVESLHIGADRPRPGHLHVSSLATAAFAGRPLVFVIGLEEGRTFPAPFEDPIVLDVEREAISPALARASDRTDESVYAACARLAAMSAQDGVKISLSYSCRDLREYRDTYASWLLLQAYRVTAGNPGATYQDLRKHLGAPKSCVPESDSAALGPSRWWLRGVVQAGETSCPAVLRQYPSLGRGVAAHDARESKVFTEFDGHVPAAGAALDPCANAVVISPTRLEEAAECPFRHFLERGLGVAAIEAGERDRDVWLDPLHRGSLLHDLYAGLLRRCRAETRRVRLPDDADWLLKRGQDVLDALALEMPPASEEIRDRETRLLLDDLRLFAAAEAALDPSRTPVGFEVAFGRTGGADPEPLNQADPIVVDLGGGASLRVAGRIDRIDRVGNATYEIVDYKTGGYWADDWKGTFAGGTRLQHALYGLAAVELLRRQDKNARVSGADYYFTSAKGQQERKPIETQPPAVVASVLRDLRAIVASGLFVHAQDEKACKWCDYGHACGRNAAARASLKLEDPILAPYLKLAAHE